MPAKIPYSIRPNTVTRNVNAMTPVSHLERLITSTIRFLLISRTPIKNSRPARQVMGIALSRWAR